MKAGLSAHPTSSAKSREHRSLRLTAAFEWPMLIAALLVIPTIAIENAELGAGWTLAATILNWLIWIAFLTEFVVLLAVAPNRRRCSNIRSSWRS